MYIYFPPAAIREIEDAVKTHKLASEYDCESFDITYFVHEETNRFVKVVINKGTNESKELIAERLWKEKYDSLMPDLEDIEFYDPETTSASSLEYEGTVRLSNNEIALIKESCQFGDFTLEMLWLIIEGLGWRPGVPVDENDQRWLVIWEKGDQDWCYINIVRNFLGMEEKDIDWIPLPVSNLIEKYKDIEAEEIMVTVRSNNGEDYDIRVKNMESAFIKAGVFKKKENHMVCIVQNGIRTHRWDRDRIVGENRWRSVDPDEMEVLGPIRTVIRS